MTIKSDQPRIPHGLSKGDRITWTQPVIRLRGFDDEMTFSGIIIDILATQFLAEDDDRHTHIVRFDQVKRPKGSNE